jgi:hypothetical protein
MQCSSWLPGSFGSRRSRALLAPLALGVGLAAGCGEDPLYVQPPTALEVIPDGEANTASATLTLPVQLESEQARMKRAALATELGLAFEDVPYVKLDDLSVSLEFSIKNLDPDEGLARVFLNGGNELFFYVPLDFVVDPDEDPTPPPLAGDIPIPIAASGIVEGIFTEDRLEEAAIDLEIITRGAANPFAAMLQVDEDTAELTTATGAVIPRQVFGQLVRFDLTFEASTHMVLEYNVRVRDHRGILHDDLLDAPAGELTAFAPVEFVPPAEPEGAVR